jgi:hypothetical protein
VKPHEHVINAGDGRHAHPTQGLLDLYTIRHYKKDFTRLTVAIVGDVLHSRVARSLIHGLTTLGVPEVRVIGPQTLMPAGVEALGVRVFHDMRAGPEGLRRGGDAAAAERAHERAAAALGGRSSSRTTAHRGQLALAKSDAIVMHPGPMNRGVEIDSPVADGPHSVILPQVTFGIAVRMAVMSIVAGKLMNLLIKGGRVSIRRAAGTRSAMYMSLTGRFPGKKRKPIERIERKGLVVAPGLIDLGAGLREPACHTRQPLESEMDAAVAGGVTSLACPPDTQPPLDEPGLVDMLRRRAKAHMRARVYPVGALTVTLAGERLTEMSVLSHAGCVAFSQANVPITDTQVLWRALQYAATFGFPVWLRAEDKWLSREGVAHDGEVATRLGLAGIPAFTETIALATILHLVRSTGARVHVCRLSTAAAVEMMRSAKKEKLPVSCDVGMPLRAPLRARPRLLRLALPPRAAAALAARSLRARPAGWPTAPSTAPVGHTPVDENQKALPLCRGQPGATAWNSRCR